MNFREFLKENIVCFDGSMGTMLQKMGLGAGELPEMWNITHPQIIIDIHKSYFEAGSNVVTTNTFGANCLKFTDDELEEIVKAAIHNAKVARDMVSKVEHKFIALDLGPTGKLLKPLGDLDFERAVEIFAKTVRLGVKYGADLIIAETLNDSYETKAALLAVKENSDLPIIVSNAYGEDKKLMTGASPAAMVALIEGMGADALGANCSLGPEQLVAVAEELLSKASIPVIIQPNAGLPKIENGQTVFDVTAEQFSSEVSKLVEKGVRIVGGCCGTTPEYIKLLSQKTASLKPCRIIDKNITAVSSYTHTVELKDTPVLIGERINPTGKKRFKQALIDNDINYILTEGVNQQEKGADILDVNVGLPDIDECQMLENAVTQLQTVTNLPLQIDTSDISAMEKALRVYNGKAMINSVNGKAESMKAVFPLVKKYGGVVVALTLDENGIPKTAQGRVEIAEKILQTAKEYGIQKKDIVFDTLALTISADNKSALETLKALNIIKNKLGCHTSLGVSNVSFGLPCRQAINSTFFTLALENGLSAAIMNPYSSDMLKVYYCYKALKGMDENCAEYIAVAENFNTVEVPLKEKQKTAEENSTELQTAIIKGFKDKSGEITRKLIAEMPPLDIVNNEIIPALNRVGVGYEKQTVYLPQLLMSAEAAKSAFEVIKTAVAGQKENSTNGIFVIATVKGDIHDIGKNIVKLLLENYGFSVVDLGKDVEPEKIADTVAELHAPLAGLSALMTTTVAAMEQTVKEIRNKAPWCKIVVGGAVLTEEYAKSMGADKYAKDAMETVRYAESVVK